MGPAKKDRKPYVIQNMKCKVCLTKKTCINLTAKTHWVSIVERLKVQPGRGEHNAARIAHKRGDPFRCKERKRQNCCLVLYTVMWLGKKSTKIRVKMLLPESD